ncbi:MAG: putative lipid II flippase FtsW [Eubacterium sp.]|nr:putative lipid II flippase FtsW [Eubacterium sp.]
MLGNFDVPYFALVMILLAIGLVMLLSASYPTAYFYGENSYSFFIKQAAFAVVGVIAMLVMSKIDYSIIRKYANILYFGAFGLLVVVLFYHTDMTVGGEAFKRYIPIGPMSFQPSEIGKFALIAFLAVYFCRIGNKVKTFQYGIFIPLVFIGMYCGLVALENHVSGMILMFALGAAIMFVGGTRSWIFWLGVIGIVAIVMVVFMFPDMLPNYVQKKLVAFTDKSFEPLGARWQINNSLYAMGSGGLFGVGLGNSKQKYMYVSEPQNDFIFSIVCEELGFIGALVIIILFILLVLRGIQIAMKARDRFGSYLVLGISAQIGIQTALNILVITDSIPNTGISLPFFSYGGTALLMLLAEMGVVLSVSRKANQRKV